MLAANCLRPSPATQARSGDLQASPAPSFGSLGGNRTPTSCFRLCQAITKVSTVLTLTPSFGVIAFAESPVIRCGLDIRHHSIIGSFHLGFGTTSAWIGSPIWLPSRPSLHSNDSYCCSVLPQATTGTAGCDSLPAGSASVLSFSTTQAARSESFG